MAAVSAWQAETAGWTTPRSVMSCAGVSFGRVAMAFLRHSSGVMPVPALGRQR